MYNQFIDSSISQYSSFSDRVYLHKTFNGSTSQKLQATSHEPILHHASSQDRLRNSMGNHAPPTQPHKQKYIHTRNISDVLQPSFKINEQPFRPPISKLEKLEAKLKTIENRLETTEKFMKEAQDKEAMQLKGWKLQHEECLEKSTIDELKQKIKEVQEECLKKNHSRRDSGGIGVKVKEVTKVLSEESKKERSFSREKLELEKTFNQNLEKLKSELQEKLQKWIAAYAKEDLHKQVCGKIQSTFDEYRRKSKSKSNLTFKSNRKYFNKPISFVYEEVISLEADPEPGKTTKPEPAVQTRACINSITYYIDEQGYLLDSSHYYLVSDSLEKIKLGEKQIKMLHKLNILIE